MNRERNDFHVKFYGAQDLSTCAQIQRVGELLDDLDNVNPDSMNDLIELVQCYRLVEAIQQSDYWAEPRKSQLMDLAMQAKNKASREIPRLLESHGIIDCVDETVVEYKEVLWGLIGSCGYHKSVKSEDVETLLKAHPEHVQMVLRHRKLRGEWKAQIRAALQANPIVGARIVLAACVEKGAPSDSWGLPGILSSGDVEAMFAAYVDSECPHLQHLEMIANWRKYAGFSLSPKIRGAAKKKRKVIEEAFFSDQNPQKVVTKQSVEIRFDPAQDACRIDSLERGSFCRTFGNRWLCCYRDEPSILTNLIHVFEMVDRFGIFLPAKPQRHNSALWELIGPRSMDGFEVGPELRFWEMLLQGSLRAYSDFLRKRECSLEAVVEWYYNKYLPQEFGLEGLAVRMPGADSSSLDKCKLIAPLIEGVAKKYELYAQDGEIDLDQYQYVQFRGFGALPSISGDAYFVGSGEDFERTSWLLFSDQSPFSYVPRLKEKMKSFHQVLLFENVFEHDFAEHFQRDLSFLIEMGLVATVQDGRLVATDSSAGLSVLWFEGAVLSRRLKRAEMAVFEDLETRGLVKRHQGLLAPLEAEYLSFCFDNREFSNGYALRNRYLHDSVDYSDSSEEEHARAYVILLSVLLLLTLKINDELNAKFKRVGLVEVVDWPFEINDEEETND